MTSADEIAQLASAAQDYQALNYISGECIAIRGTAQMMINASKLLH
jgi:hypothetical protein